ncbi:MAG: hypothetical protein ACWGKN_08785 [Desulfoprunum sp.]|nr:hypothetical protein JT06_13945 [Desulfobulbus sp. Tol-SR]
MNTLLNVTADTASDIAALEAELRSGLQLFWRTAATILDDGPIRLSPPDEATLSLPRNFFSMLFLYSYYRIGVPAERRILYAAVNQCLRGMVTGCDNLLDDEYKTTLETDLPLPAHRFRSVLDIMVADRVLFAVLADHCHRHALPVDLALQASAASLRALTLSGAQEAAEEEGIAERIAPEIVLGRIHHDKTGVLFQSPWAVPSVLEADLPPEAATVQEALFQVGIGCQILDDLVDLFRDVRQQRHNYVASIIVHREPRELWQQLQTLLPTDQTPDRLYADWPDFAARLKTEAMTTIEQGLRALFFDRHHDLVHPAALFVASRIGAAVAY